MITFTTKGDWQKTDTWLKKMSSGEIYKALGQYGATGVSALANATPVESGLTASSWYYEVYNDGKYYGIIWKNSHIVDGRPIAILLQYGHGTRTGGYVQGRDYINPAIQGIFDKIANDVWKVVTQ